MDQFVVPSSVLAFKTKLHLKGLVDILTSLEISNFGTCFSLYVSNQAFMSKSKIIIIFLLFPSSAKNQADRQAEVREIKRRLTRKVKQHINNKPLTV